MPVIVAEDFDEAFQRFEDGCRRIVAENHAKSFSSLRFPWLEVEPIKANTRYVRIWCCDDWNREAIQASKSPSNPVSRRSHVFVDRTNGDVLKCESWKKPAKHARGNIFAADNGLSKMGPYGAEYLR
jgi:hypothetical protein